MAAVSKNESIHNPIPSDGREINLKMGPENKFSKDKATASSKNRFNCCTEKSRLLRAFCVTMIEITVKTNTLSKIFMIKLYSKLFKTQLMVIFLSKPMSFVAQSL